jgi:hypothetical protein
MEKPTAIVYNENIELVFLKRNEGYICQMI